MISAKEKLVKMLLQRTIPHALLFVGTEIETIALEFAADLLALDGAHHRTKALSCSHPDLCIYKTEGKGGVHPVKNLRELVNNIGLVPLEASRKVFIIHDAERMLAASSNALLKTFEEPPLDTVFILLTMSIEKILPTIRSRCFSLYFPIAFEHPAKKEILDLLAKKISIESFSSKYQEMATSDSLFQKTLLQTWSNWYRDRALLNIEGGDKFLYFPEYLGEIKKTSLLPLEKVEKTLKKVSLALERSMKLSLCLEILAAI